MGTPYIADGDLAKMRYSRNFVNAYRDMKKSGNWTEYTTAEPYWSSELFTAALMSDEMDKFDGR